jgi:homogentisate 1,2-dioxygenase
MKNSWIHVSSGEVPRQARVAVPHALREEHVSRQGFAGQTAMLYHRNPPTRALRVEGPMVPMACDVATLATADHEDARGTPQRVLSNADLRLSISRRTQAMPYCLRNIDGDLLYFVHRGSGVFATEFGPLAYGPGDFIHIPKGITFRQLPEAGESYCVVLESQAPIGFTEHAQVGRHAPFDPTVLEIPKVADYDWPQQDEWELRLQHGDTHTSYFYAHCPMDLAGWKGDLFPHRLNIEDIRPLTSERLHLAPSSWSVYESAGFMLVAFLPMAIVNDPLAEELPDYHRNIDTEEAIFVHRTGRRAEGTLMHMPQGVTHGPTEESRHAFEAMRQPGMARDFVAISVDAVRRLERAPELATHAKAHPPRPGRF